MKYLLTIEDGFSRFLMAIPVPNKNAETLAEAMLERFIPVLGIPQQLHSNNGLELCNRVWESLCEALGILHTTTPVYNPSSNLVERAHRTLGEIFRATEGDMAENWDLKVGSVVFVYNTSVHSSTGYTPYEVLYGRAPVFPVDLVFPLPEMGGRSLHAFVGDCIEMFQKMHERMREVQQNVAQRAARSYNPHGAQRLEVGSRVWYFTPRVWGAGIRKLRSSWGGPYRIVRKIALTLFVIRAEHEGAEIVAGSDSLRLYHESRTGQPDEAPDVQLDDLGDEYGELLGMPEENELLGTGAPIYELGEEEELELAWQTQQREAAIPRRRTPITPRLEVTLWGARNLGIHTGVTRSKQTGPVCHSAGQQTELPINVEVQTDRQVQIPNPVMQPARREEEADRQADCRNRETRRQRENRARREAA